MVVNARGYPLAYNSELLQLFADISNIQVTLAAFVASFAAFAALFSAFSMSWNYYFKTFNDTMAQIHEDNSALRITLLDINTTNSALLDLIITQQQILDTVTEKQQELYDLHSAYIQEILETSSYSLSNLTALSGTQSDILSAVEDIDIPAIVEETIEETEFSLNCPTVSIVGFDGLACEYDPLGVGPINCDGVELEEAECEVAHLTPVA